MKKILQLDFFTQLVGLARKPALDSTTAPTIAAPKAPPCLPVESGSDLEQKVHTLLAAIGEDALARVVRVAWNPRMRSTAGMAYPRKNIITLNPRLRDFGDEEVDRTLRHELAHLLAHHRAGRRRISAHGPEWARACRDLGLPDEKRCHDLPLPRRKMTARHFYRCPSCAQVLSRVRPLRGKSACLACCRKHNGGRYHDRFRFVRSTGPSA